MTVIGLCGASGSGKGSFSKLLSSYGILSIDTDKLYHTLLDERQKCYLEIVDLFGESILTNGYIDRKKLADIVFRDKGKKEQLQKVAFRHILERTESIIESEREKKSEFVIIDAPLLFESGFDKLCDVTVCVYADDEVRISRIMNRDSIDENRARMRINAQTPQMANMEKCDYQIENNGDKELLKSKADDLITKLRVREK